MAKDPTLWTELGEYLDEEQDRLGRLSKELMFYTPSGDWIVPEDVALRLDRVKSLNERFKREFQ